MRPYALGLRENLTVVVIPMYNPDGAEANIRQSTTPTRIDLNRDRENFAQPESVAFWKLWRDTAPELALDLHHMGPAGFRPGLTILASVIPQVRSEVLLDTRSMPGECWPVRCGRSPQA